VERRLTVHARTHRKKVKAAIVIGALLASVPAIAAPKGKAAKAAFDRGVAAYQQNDFAGASKALGESYELEHDVETLFAWAQSERQQNKCDTAIELYDKLLAADMPAENKAVVQSKLEECKAIVAAMTGVLDKPIEDPDEQPRPPEAPEPQPEGRTPWWKDPIGDALTVGGVLGIGVGAYFLYSGKRAEDASKESHADFESEQDKAESHGKIGVILTVTGGVLLVGGIVRYITRSSGAERTSVSGWITPDGGGGLAAFGRF
jgi:tetratricopeptide (TPR) repeat protein